MRHFMHGLRFFTLFAALLTCAAPGALAAPPLYTVTDLGTLQGNEATVQADSINNSSQVVGYNFDISLGPETAFIWNTQGGIQQLSLPSGYSTPSNANAINSLGQVTGQCFVSYWEGQQAYLLNTDGTALALGSLFPESLYHISAGTCINTSGQVAGYSDAPTTTGGTQTHAFLWSLIQGMQDLTPNGGYSTASGINDSGQVVGQAVLQTTGGGSVQHAVLWQNGQVTDLGTLGGSTSAALGINAIGQVVGNATTATYQTRPFLWQSGQMTDLGLPTGSTYGSAQAVNAAGLVVGVADVQSQNPIQEPYQSAHAALWQGGQFYDLNTVLYNNPGWTLTAATAINDSGQIVGDGTINGQAHAFLLTPIPASAIAMLSSLSPATSYVNDPAFMLTVDGSGFVPTSTAFWNGTALTTTFVSPTVITAQVPATFNSVPGGVPVTVTNSASGAASNALTFTVQPLPIPQISSLSPNSVSTGGPDLTFTITGSGFRPNAQVFLTLGSYSGVGLATAYVSSTQLMATVPASDLTYAQAGGVFVSNDDGGLATSNTTPFTVVAGPNAVPVTTSTSPSGAFSSGSSFYLQVFGTGFVPGSTVDWNGQPLSGFFVSRTQIYGIVPASLAAIPGPATVTVVNPAPGGGTSNAQTFQVYSQPATTTSISPSSGMVGGPGFTLTVIGSGFVPGAAVLWNGTTLPTTYVSSSQVTAPVPATDLTVANQSAVLVQNPNQYGGTYSPILFNTVNPVPTLSSVSPSVVMGGGPGFTITVTGTNFVPGDPSFPIGALANSEVYWNGAQLATTYVSPTQVQATVLPAEYAAAGTVSVTVVNNAPGGGTSNSLPLTVTAPPPPPVLTSLSPSTVIVGGAAFTMTLNGTNFGPNPAVEININGTAIPTTLVSSTQLTALIPAYDIMAIGTVTVTVVNNAPWGAVSNGLPLTITVVPQAPTITSLSPTSVTAGGPAFTLSAIGGGFFPSTTLDWNGVALATTYVSNMEVTAQVPASDVATAGTANVTAVTPAPGGGSSDVIPFGVYAPNPAPTLNSVNPTSATAGGAAFTLSASGTGFVFGSTVDWNGTALTTAFVSSTQLTAQVPASDVASAGTASVTVVTPAPGGGTSTALPFTVQPVSLYRINTGGGITGTFFADGDYSGGTAAHTTAAVSTAGVTGPAPQAVYQTERYGNFTYTLPNLTPGAAYTLRLHFAEIYWTSAGRRLFNVSVNGLQVLTNFDVFAAAGGKDKAIVETLPATADGNGRITVTFTTLRDNAKVSGIEVLGAQPVAPTITAAATATPNPVSGTTAGLSVTAVAPNAVGPLTYIWSGPAGVSFSPNGTTSSAGTTATFTGAGSYPVQVTVQSADGLTATSSVTVVVAQTPTALTVSPATATVTTGQTQQFAAAVSDQFGSPIAGAPVTWSVPSAAGSVSAGGLFAAGVTAGTYTVTATGGTATGSAAVTVAAPAPTGIALNAGGGATGAFAADGDYSGGTAAHTTAAVSTAGVTGPAPQAVYQTERYGNFTYTLPGLTPGGSYTLRLHFTEIYWTSAGRRLFNVSVNGLQVLTNFDVFAAAGGKDKAIVETFPVTAAANGRITVTFTTLRDNAKVSGIELTQP